MDTACIRILEPDTAFSKVSVSGRIHKPAKYPYPHTHTPEYPHTGAVCGYNTHIGAVGTDLLSCPMHTAPPQAPGDPTILQQIPSAPRPTSTAARVSGLAGAAWCPVVTHSNKKIHSDDLAGVIHGPIGASAWRAGAICRGPFHVRG